MRSPPTPSPLAGTPRPTRRLRWLLLVCASCVPPTPQVFGPPAVPPAAPAAGTDPGAPAAGEDGWGDGGDEAWGAPAEAPPVVAAPSVPSASASAGALAIAFSGDWQAVGGWRVFTRQVDEWAGPRVWRTLVRALSALPAQGDFNQALQQAVRTYLPAELQGKVAPHAYRRYLGDGLFAQYSYAVGPERGNKDDTWFTLYLIDCGATWELVEVASIYTYPGVSGPWNIGVREAQEAAEPVLSTIRCAGPRNQPLFDLALFARHWYFGSGGSMDYVNVFTGSSWSSSVSYAGDYELRSDGGAIYSYSGATTVAGATQFGGQAGRGTWSFAGDTLTIAIRGLAPRVYRVATVADFPDATLAVMLKPELAAMPTAVTSPEVVFTTKSTYGE